MSTGIGIGASFIFGGIVPSPSFEYDAVSYCKNASNPTPTINGTPGGVFTAAPVSPSTGTLVINSSTGEVDIAASDPGNYLVTYTVGGVAESDPFQVVAMQTTGFSYSASSFEDNGIATPTITGSAGGTFTAPEGISINSSTGVIDLAASTVGGPYTITYSNNGICAGTPSTFDVTITATVRIIANNFAMEFISADDTAVNVASDVFGGMTNFSISSWFKMSVNNHDQPIIARWQNAPSGILLYWDYTNGWRILFQTDTGQKTFQSSIQSSGSGLPTVDVWYHLCVTYDGSNIKFYLNSSTTDTGSTTAGTLNTITDWQIGRDGPSLNRIFDGDIDEVAIWNTALSASAVQEIYDATINNPGYSADLFKLANESQSPVFWNRMGD